MFGVSLLIVGRLMGWALDGQWLPERHFWQEILHSSDKSIDWSWGRSTLGIVREGVCGRGYVVVGAYTVRNILTVGLAY